MLPSAPATMEREEAMDYHTITVEVDGPVGTLALDNPSKLNTLSVECLVELPRVARRFLEACRR